MPDCLPPARLRVCVVFDTAGFQRSLPLTGAAARTLHLNRHLAQHGAEVTLLLGDLNPSSAPTAAWPFPVHYLTYEDLYEDTAALVGHVRRLRPHVLVMSNTQLAVRYGRLLAQAGGAALLYEMHDDEAALARSLNSPEWEVRQASLLQGAAIAAADTVIAFTARDADAALALNAENVHIVPCGTDTRPRTPVRRQRPGIAAFLGNLYYAPNRRAVGYLHTELAPRLAKNGGAIEVYGRYPPTLRHLHTPAKGLRLHGPVPDLHTALSTAQVALAPLDCGGGMKLKVLQYLGAGLPVVGTAEAFIGLPDPQNYALVSTSPDMSDLPALVDRLHQDADLREQLGAAGHHLARTALSWKTAARTALNAYTAAADAARTSHPRRRRSEPAGQLARRPPYWLREWRKNQQEPAKGSFMQDPVLAAAEASPYPNLARLTPQIDCARHAAESALGITFDQDVIVGYGGRSMVLMAHDAVLKIYTHRPAERAGREVAGLTAAAAAPALRIPRVLGHDSVNGALSWVSTTRLTGSAPDNGPDAASTQELGAIAARLHTLTATDLADLPVFRRNIRPLPGDQYHLRAELTQALEAATPAHQTRCVNGFVHGDFSARNILTTPTADPGVIDFEGCGTGCIYEDLTNCYVHNCLIDGRDASQLFFAYQDQRAQLATPLDLDTAHLLFHTARYFRWVLQWAPEIDPQLTARITALAPPIIKALTTNPRPTL
ncbi:phosphotransferase [Streptomyces sp. SGAir0957]